jgi:Crinkler effector protein N-terminal domain
MDIDSDLLKLNFVPVSNGLAYGEATFYTIAVSSSNNLSELRDGIHARLSRSLDGVSEGALKLYKATLTESESESLLDSLESGQGINLTDSKFSLLRGFATLGSWFSEGFHQNAVHIIVDCSAGKHVPSTCKLHLNAT